MFETTVYEMKKSWKRDSVIGVAMGLMGALMVAIYPSIKSEMNINELIQSFPEAMQSVFGATGVNSIEGFLALEMYGLFWLAMLGAYFAYRAGGLISGEIESGKIDNTLVMPVTRTEFLLEKFASLITPIVTLNLFVVILTFAASIASGVELSLQNLILVHLFSVPYFFICGSIGLLLSTLLERESSGRRIGAGVMFGLFMLGSLTEGTDYSILGALSPARYYDTSALITEGTINLANTGILITATVTLLILSVTIFQRKDL